MTGVQTCALPILTVSTPAGKALVVDNDTDELVILCDWCDGFGK